MTKEIKVFAPASVSNIACGFDIMGFAVDKPGDELVLRRIEEKSIVIKSITGDDGCLTKEVSKNTAGLPIIELFKDFNLSGGVEIEIHKKMPLGSGLGSSAASAVAAAFAMNNLFELNLTNMELLNYAIKGEELASGAVHADNVAPCLFGGFILIRSYDPIDIIELHVPDNLYCSILHLDVKINTKESRKLLPTEVPLNLAIKHWGNTAGLIAGLYKNDIALIGRAIEDFIIEPVRGKFIPNYYKIKQAAYEAGAAGCNISGSGPSVFALSDNPQTAEKISHAMENAAAEVNVKTCSFVSQVNKVGPKVIYKN